VQVERIGEVGARLIQWGLPQLIDTAQLIASELITNASQAAKGNEIGLELILTARSLIVKATDDSLDIPDASDDADDPLAESGRGLALVAALSARTGYYFTDSRHKVVWSEILHNTRPGKASGLD
jgi:anti-sigma regulatory factor (Ser/Thr protein kinase)